MGLTKGQEKGLKMVVDLASGTTKKRVCVLAGVAGSGKTTLLKRIAEEIGTPVIIAPTGKAAARVREATGLPASTIHRWLYNPIQNTRTGETSFVKKSPDQLDRGECNLIVVEESSMVSKDVWIDILESANWAGTRILCIGDPFQLPPVDDKDPDFSVLDPQNPDVDEYILMTEIVRQAQESPIIKASMLVRQGDIMGAISMLPRIQVSSFLDTADQTLKNQGIVIVHKNSTRQALNNSIRQKRGLPQDLQPGEPLLVIRNNYNLQCFNGETYTFTGWTDEPIGRHTILDWWLKTREESRFGVGHMVDESRGHGFPCILSEAGVFGLLKSGHAATSKVANIIYPDPTLSFVGANLGYVMTAHKSQGSEWDNVLVGIEQSVRFNGKDAENSLRWVYTAITRSRKNLTICLGVPV